LWGKKDSNERSEEKEFKLSGKSGRLRKNEIDRKVEGRTNGEGQPKAPERKSQGGKSRGHWTPHSAEFPLNKKANQTIPEVLIGKLLGYKGGGSAQKDTGFRPLKK